MSERRPDFDELVGADLPPAERERLLRVHELLLEAGPPPDDISTSPPVVALRPRRRRGMLLALAATLAVVVAAATFAAGAVVGHRTAGRDVDFHVAMSGTAAAPEARGTLTVFELDEAGNWPLEFAVSGLAPSPSGRPFELWLVRNGKPVALCGSFRTEPDGTASVPMNAPYEFRDFEGWVVVEEGTSAPLLTT